MAARERLKEEWEKEEQRERRDFELISKAAREERDRIENEMKEGKARQKAKGFRNLFSRSE